jgi:hypothetical protein
LGKQEWPFTEHEKIPFLAERVSYTLMEKAGGMMMNAETLGRISINIHILVDASGSME